MSFFRPNLAKLKSNKDINGLVKALSDEKNKLDAAIALSEICTWQNIDILIQILAQEESLLPYEKNPEIIKAINASIEKLLCIQNTNQLLDILTTKRKSNYVDIVYLNIAKKLFLKIDFSKADPEFVTSIEINKNISKLITMLEASDTHDSAKDILEHLGIIALSELTKALDAGIYGREGSIGYLLSKIKTIESADCLNNYLNHHGSSKLSIVFSLASLKDERAIPYLIPLTIKKLSGYDPNIYKTAIRVLSGFKGNKLACDAIISASKVKSGRADEDDVILEALSFIDTEEALKSIVNIYSYTFYKDKPIHKYVLTKLDTIIQYLSLDVLWGKDIRISYFFYTLMPILSLEQKKVLEKELIKWFSNNDFDRFIIAFSIIKTIVREDRMRIWDLATNCIETYLPDEYKQEARNYITRNF